MKKGSEHINEKISRRFDASSIKNEGWNEPHSGIWGKIEKDLFAERDERVLFWKRAAITFLIISLALTGYLYVQNQRLLQFKEEVSVPQPLAFAQNFEEVQNENVNIPRSSAERIEHLEAVERIEHSEAAETIVNVTNTEVNIIPIPNLFANSTEAINTKDGIEKVGALTSRRENPNDLSKNLTPKIGRIGISILPLPFNPIIEENNEEAIPPKKVEVVSKPEHRNFSLSILPQVGTAIISTKGSQETPLTELINTEYGSPGFGLDVIVAAPISRNLEFSFGLGFEQMNFTTEYDLTLPYITDNETINGEFGFIDFEHSLPTAFGNTNTGLRLNRLRNNSIDEPSVILDFNTKHRFNTISLPLGLMYTLGVGETQINVGVYTRPMYFIHSSSSMKSVFSHHSAIDASHSVSHSVYEDIRKFNIGAGLKIGFLRKLSKRGSIGCFFDYQNLMFPIYEASNYSTKVQRLGISLGYTYSI